MHHKQFFTTTQGYTRLHHVFAVAQVEQMPLVSLPKNKGKGVERQSRKGQSIILVREGQRQGDKKLEIILSNIVNQRLS